MHNQWNSFGIETGICCKSISCGRTYNKSFTFETSEFGMEARERQQETVEGEKVVPSWKGRKKTKKQS